MKEWPGNEECLILLEKAIDLAKEGYPSVDKIRQLGEGWVGDEALAIAVYCALPYPDDFAKALILSVNHDGDSDSTGAVTGNIMGAYLGITSIPKKWIENIELKAEIIQLSDDLLAGYESEKGWEEKYPGW